MALAIQNIDYSTQVKAYKAEAAIVANTIVKRGTLKGTCIPGASGDAAGILGVALHAAAIGESVDVAEDGATVPVVSAAAIVLGALVGPNAAAKAITLAPGAGLTLEAVGEAAEPAGAADVKIGVRIRIQRVTNGGT
jgi:hypothetical protein